jgi:protein-disulfide isomerase
MFKKEANLGLIATIVACTILISGSIIFLGVQLGKSGSSTGAEVSNTGRNDDLQPLLNTVTADTENKDDAILGDPEAPVTIVEYSDYQCPFCRSYFENAYQQIVTEYVDKGLVKVIFKDYPLNFHQDAIFAANASECARKEGGDKMYYAFHDGIFQAQGPASNGTVSITDEMVEGIAKDLKINSREFRTCVEDKEFHSEIAADFLAATEARAARVAEVDQVTGEVKIREALTAETASEPQFQEAVGVNATPTLFVNDIKVIGAQPFEVFQAAIDAELNK